MEIDWYLQAVNNCLDEYWLKQANSSRTVKLKQRDTRRENTMYLKNLLLDNDCGQGVLDTCTFTLPFVDLDSLHTLASSTGSAKASHASDRIISTEGGFNWAEFRKQIKVDFKLI